MIQNNASRILPRQKNFGWEPKVERAEGLKITYEYFKSLATRRMK